MNITSIQFSRVSFEIFNSFLTKILRYSANSRSWMKFCNKIFEVKFFNFCFKICSQMFDVSGKMFHLLIVTLFAGLAAIGFGVLIGTMSNTQEQSAPFGATSVVVLAAIGGIWVPVFLMPEFMQKIAQFSPMNWGLNAYYDIILRNSGISEIAKELIFLFLFYIAMVTISLLYERKQNSV